MSEDFDIREFERELRDQMQQEPPEVTKAINENFWDLFGDPEDVGNSVRLSVTVKWSDEDDCFVALEHNRNASAFADTPADAMRELATVIELYEEAQSDD